MSTNNKGYLSACILALSLAGVANANTVNIGANVNAPPAVVYALTSFTTTGADMATFGLKVVVHFSDNSVTAPIAWTTNVAGCTSAAGCGQASGVAGNGTWTLRETGDTGAVFIPAFPDQTAFNPWTLTNTSTNLAITQVDLLGGNLIVFDRNMNSAGVSSGGQEGTPNSAGGIDYTFSSESGGPASGGFTVGVTYSRIVQINGPPVTCMGSAFNANTTATGCQDEWNNLTFSFTAGTFRNTGSGNAVWAFFQDSDNVGVPEPLTLGLMGAGLLGLAVYRKRRVTVLSD